MWSAEHQAAFEAKHAAHDQSPGHSRPDRAVVPKQRVAFYGWMVRLTLWALIWGLGGWLVAWLLHLPNFVKPIIGAPIAIMVFAWIPAWLFGFLYYGWKTMSGAVDAATTPIPSLQEIEAQLRAEGYNPTLADCVAVDGYLRRNRNEKIAVGAAFVVIARGL